MSLEDITLEEYRRAFKELIESGADVYWLNECDVQNPDARVIDIEVYGSVVDFPSLCTVLSKAGRTRND